MTGVFFLSRSNKNSGEKLIPVWKKFRSFGRLPLYWGVTLGWGETEVNRYLADFQASEQLVGGYLEKLEDFRCGLKVSAPLGIDSW